MKWLIYRRRRTRRKFPESVVWSMHWHLHHLPGFGVSPHERMLTLDGGETQYSWTPWDDETVERWLQETTVHADDPDEAARAFIQRRPSCLHRVDDQDSVDAMMSFLRGAHHRDPAGHPMGRWHDAPQLSQQLDLRGRGMRATRGESPIDADEIDEVGEHVGSALSRLLRRIASLFGPRNRNAR